MIPTVASFATVEIRKPLKLSCHKTIPDKDPAVSLMSHVAQYAGVKIDRKEHSEILHKIVLIGAWGQVLAELVIGLGLFFLIFWFFRRK